MSLLGDIWQRVIGRDPLPMFLASMAEVKEMRDQYKKELDMMHIEREEMAKRLQASEESERDCRLRMVEMVKELRDVKEELLVIRDWQNRNT